MQRTDKELLIADLTQHPFFEDEEINYMVDLIEKDLEQNGEE
jgi:hypothetical protein